MRAVRLLLVAFGIGCGWYGISLLLRAGPTELRSVTFWFAGGILAHDALFAPTSAAIGLAGRRLLPRRWWAPTACGAVCTVTLIAIATPVLFRAHAVAGNPTVLDRNYVAGLVLALSVVWGLVIVALVRGRAAGP